MIEVSIVAVKERRFRNRGFVNLPFCTMYGVMAVILQLLWPHLVGHPVFKFVAAFVVFVAVQSFAEFITARVCRCMVLKYEDITPYNGEWMNLLVAILFAAGLWVVLELVHPFVFFLAEMLPDIALKVFDALVGGFIGIDFLITLYTMYRNRGNRNINAYKQKNQELQSNLNGRIYEHIWNRLNKAYPNMEDEPEQKHVFADGICLDKLIWVFLVSALLGDIIETLYCRAVGGVWMSRSSVLYGPFSIVWGIGAVVLTLILSRFAHKPDRYIFLIGALVGGVYEYGCSLLSAVSSF